MTPLITDYYDSTFASEEVDPETNALQHTSLGLIDNNDTLYYGQLDAPKTEISFDQIMAALQPVPDDAIFPEWPLSCRGGTSQDTRNTTYTGLCKASHAGSVQYAQASEH